MAGGRLEAWGGGGGGPGRVKSGGGVLVNVLGEGPCQGLREWGRRMTIAQGEMTIAQGEMIIAQGYMTIAQG